MATPLSPSGSKPLRVSVVAIPEAAASTLFGIVDVMQAFAFMGIASTHTGLQPPFEVEIVGEKAAPLQLASGVPVNVQNAVNNVEASDIVIVPSMLLRSEGWQKGRYPQLVHWLGSMHDRGAVLCSVVRESFCWPKPDCSTEKTPPCTSSMHARLQQPIPPCPSIPSAY